MTMYYGNIRILCERYECYGIVIQLKSVALINYIGIGIDVLTQHYWGLL